VRFFIHDKGIISERPFRKPTTCAYGERIVDETKFVELVIEYSDMVYRLALHDCRNPQDAEDIMQTVFMKLYTRKPEFESLEHGKYWLLKVTANECKRLFASSWKKKTDYLETFGEQGEIPDDFTENTREKEQRELILEAVFELPRKYRMPVYLYYYEEYSVAEIAGILGRNPSTIQTQLDRARRKLKKQLEEAGYYE